MRDFRDAKTMAHMLRETLAAKHCRITVGESLELIAKLFGAADWNTLSAFIKRADEAPNAGEATGRGNGPQFAPTLERTLHEALRAAGERGHAESTVEHLLLALTEDPDATAMMKAAAVDPAAIREILKHSAQMEIGPRDGNWDPPSPTPPFQRSVQRAILNTQASGERIITGADLLLALLSEEDTAAVQLLREHGFDRGSAMRIAGRRKG
jgi:hypothetical protein